MNKRILLAEDNEAILEVLSLFLTDEGYEVTAAGNGREALRQIERQTPDLLITDILMPEMDGLTLLTQLRGIEGRRIPAIAVAASQHRLQQAAELIGNTNCFAKPFDLDELLARVHYLIGPA